MKEIRSIHICGMGALGLNFGLKLATALPDGATKYLLDDARYARYQDKHFTINGEPVHPHMVRGKEAGIADLVIVATKYTGLFEAMDTIAPSVGEDTIILSILNGVTSEEILRERFGKNKVVDSVSQGMDAMHFGDEIRYSKFGELCIGLTDDATQENLDAVLALFNKAGFPYTLDLDIRHRMWSKFMLNCGLNQCACVYNATYGDLLRDGSKEMAAMVAAMREVIALANAEGIHLTEKDLNLYLDIQRTLAPENRPSMGQDRLNKRPTEVELFAGTVIKKAEKYGICTAVNQYLYNAVKKIEASYLGH
ncbi:MAG: ketopantoate reductase family protein [Lachnospiraceae bacterium]|nr:ketopantoate reductase family protein [Lachnospiraceae bacterium]